MDNKSQKNKTIYESTDLDPDAIVIIASGHGKRFHRPNSLGFETICKTGFRYPVQKVPLSKAIEEGFTPCAKSACFG